jgi:uncharacterized protein (TIGR00369 family)
MPVWKKSRSLQELNDQCRGTIHDALGITFTAVEDGKLSASMPVGPSVRQPFGLLHGGASVVLAESLGSMAAFLAIEEGELALGVEVNANHLLAVRNGTVTGTATPLTLGRNLHVWSIEIRNDQGALVCICRLTVLIKPARPATA